MSNITTEQKFRWENSTRLLYFKHRGNLASILDELRELYPATSEESRQTSKNDNITFEFVQKVIRKFKKDKSKDYSMAVAANFMEYAFMGTKQREMQCATDLDKVADFEFYDASVCCMVAAVIKEKDGVKTFVCPKCKQPCAVEKVPNPSILAYRQSVREEMRKDEESLIKAVKDLGFLGQEPATREVHNHYEFHSKRAKAIESQEISEEDQKLLTNLEEQDPRTREAIRKDLQRRLNELEGQEIESRVDDEN